MMRWSVLLANALMALAVFAADELPTADLGELLEIEPPLLIGNRAPDEAQDKPESEQNDGNAKKLAHRLNYPRCLRMINSGEK